MNEEKIKEVFSNEEFVKSLMELETPEEVQKALAEKDIDLSTDEIGQIAEILQKNTEGALNDEELEAVAGGSITCGVFVGIIVAQLVGTAAACVHVQTRRRW